jgi:hypothetical protein
MSRPSRQPLDFDTTFLVEVLGRSRHFGDADVYDIQPAGHSKFMLYQRNPFEDRFLVASPHLALSVSDSA